MDEKDESPPAPQAGQDDPGVTTAEQPAAKKPYKSPTIKRHGNLRLMTQLE